MILGPDHIRKNMPIRPRNRPIWPERLVSDLWQNMIFVRITVLQ